MQIFIICTTFEVKSELQWSCELELHYRSEVLTQSPLLMNQSPRNRLFRLNPLMFSGNDAVNEGFSNHGDTTMLRLYIVQRRFAFQEIVSSSWQTGDKREQPIPRRAKVCSKAPAIHASSSLCFSEWVAHQSSQSSVNTFTFTRRVRALGALTCLQGEKELKL